MLYIRADMNDIIATGHIMRCLAIADAAKSMGEDTVFITADEQPAGLLKERGYSCHVLGTDWRDPDSELPALQSFLEECRAQKLLLDSYQVTPAYLKKLDGLVKIMYLDDLNTFHYSVSGLICYANYWEKFNYTEKYTDTKLFLGPQFVPLRSVFSHCSEKRIRPRIENLLLLSGGTDPYGILKGLLSRIPLHEYRRIDVICGRYDSAYGQLHEKFASDPVVHIHKAVSAIEEYMERADAAVSAGGTTLYELCAAGTPTVSYAVADNQLDNVRRFDSDGLITWCGDVRCEDVPGKVLQALEACRDEKVRRERSRKMRELVDGRGAARIVRAMREL